MEITIESEGPIWPLGVPLSGVGGQANGKIDVAPGLTILVGPNGSGKTRALRSIKTALNGTNRIAVYGRKVRFLAAGRSSPFEQFRSSVTGPHNTNISDAAVGQRYFFQLPIRDQGQAASSVGVDFLYNQASQGGWAGPASPGY